MTLINRLAHAKGPDEDLPAGRGCGYCLREIDGRYCPHFANEWEPCGARISADQSRIAILRARGIE